MHSLKTPKADFYVRLKAVFSVRYVKKNVEFTDQFQD